MTTVLITGAGGNVGRLIRPLLRERYQLKSTDLAKFEALPGEITVRGDLSDPDFSDFAVSGVDSVVHLAGKVGSDFEFEDILDANYRGLLNLLEACRRNRTKRFIFASSHHVIGMHPSSTSYSELAPLAPDTHYGLSKAFGESACSMYAHRFRIRTMILRIGNADPLVVDARRERLWTSGRDMVSLIQIGLEHPGINCETVYAVSKCPEALFDNRRAEELGYDPVDFAGDNRSANFKSRSKLSPEAVSRVGGFFASAELPSLKGKQE